jgi:hypothetical protein
MSYKARFNESELLNLNSLEWQPFDCFKEEHFNAHIEAEEVARISAADRETSIRCLMKGKCVNLQSDTELINQYKMYVGRDLSTKSIIIL